MQRKIKFAKSTISAIQGPSHTQAHEPLLGFRTKLLLMNSESSSSPSLVGTKKSQSQASPTHQPRACLETSGEEWNLNKEWAFSGDEQGYGLAENLIPLSDQSCKPRVDDALKPKERSLHEASRYGDASTNEPHSKENISPQLSTSHEEHQYELGLPNDMDDLIALTERFHENFKDCDDDLLSQIWSSCKRENALFDDTTGLNRTRQIGASSLHTADFDSSPIPLSKMISKEKRIPKIQRLHTKKSPTKNSVNISQFMKKREGGWRE